MSNTYHAYQVDGPYDHVYLREDGNWVGNSRVPKKVFTEEEKEQAEKLLPNLVFWEMIK